MSLAASSAHEFSDASGFHESDTRNLPQRGFIGRRKQTSIDKGRGEVGIRLPFDDDTTIDVVVTDGKTLHSNIEVAARSREIE
jgi:hypothetical protein